MKKILFISFLFFFIQTTFAKDKIKYISIEKYIKDNSINTKITGVGGYSEECLNFEIENLKPDTLFILLEPGRRIVSYDSTIQDILILKTVEITLPPLASIILKGYGFCCQSSNSSPSFGSKFNIGFMAPKTWVEFAEFADKSNFPADALQNAVWVLSNNHPLSSIHNEKPELVFELKKIVAKLTKQEIPWYSLTFEKDTANLFSNKPERIFGKIDYYVKHNSVISINIRDAEGNVVATLIKKLAQNPGEYYYNLNLSVKGWKKGKYTINIIRNYSNIIAKKEFSL